MSRYPFWYSLLWANGPRAGLCSSPAGMHGASLQSTMQDITSGAHALTILGIEVRADENGRYSLNDLHRAAMVAAGRAGDPNKDHQRPALFLRTASLTSSPP